MVQKVTYKVIKKAYDYYSCGPTLSKTAKEFNIPRTTLYEYFKIFKFKLRPRKEIPYIIFNNEKFTLRTDGYFKSTTSGNKLHRVLYEQQFGKIPDNHYIVFKDRNKNNLSINNLMCCTRSEATKHQIPTNAYLKRNPKLLEKIEKFCPQCNTQIFARNNSTLKKRVYCSKKCADDSKRKIKT